MRRSIQLHSHITDLYLSHISTRSILAKMAPLLRWAAQAAQAVLTWSSISPFVAPTVLDLGYHSNNLQLDLTPRFYENGSTSSIWVRTKVRASKGVGRKAGRPLFSHRSVSGPVKANKYKAGSVFSSDVNGPLNLSATDSQDGALREWVADRDITGEEVVVQYLATPRTVTVYDSCGPEWGLESDGGGLAGAGGAFLLTYFDNGDEESDFNINITWNLENAPSGTRAVSTFGEGHTVSTYGKPSVLL